MNEFYIRNVVEAALLAAGKSLQLAELGQLFDETTRPKVEDLQAGLAALAVDYANRGLELKETAAGFRIQVRKEFAGEISRLWPERPAKYSRALLETLALIAYRQPITRAEIEQVRGVAVNPNIVKTVIERNWVRVVGHRDVPGRPELLGTTREFLDYFGLRSLDELPALADVKAMGDYNLQLELPNAGALGVDGKPEGGDSAPVAGLLTNGSGEGAAEGAAAAVVEGAAEGAVAAVAEGAGESAVAAVAEGAAEGAVAAVAEGAGENVAAVVAEGTDELVASAAVEGSGESVTAAAADGVAGEGAVATAAEGAAGEGADFVAQVETVEVESVMADGDDAEAVAGEGGAVEAVASAQGGDTTHAGHAADHDVSDTTAHAGVSHAANDAVATVQGETDETEAHRTLTGDHAAQHAAESDDSEASDSSAASESLEPLDDGSDDDADEDELSADGHGSRELVAAPRDGDE